MLKIRNFLHWIATLCLEGYVIVPGMPHPCLRNPRMPHPPRFKIPLNLHEVSSWYRFKFQEDANTLHQPLPLAYYFSRLCVPTSTVLAREGDA